MTLKVKNSPDKSKKIEKIAIKKVDQKKKVKKIARATKPVEKADKPRHRALVQERTFDLISKNGRHKITVPVVFIDDIVIFDDIVFADLSKSAAMDAESQLDQLCAEFIGYTHLVDVTTLE